MVKKMADPNKTQWKDKIEDFTITETLYNDSTITYNDSDTFYNGYDPEEANVIIPRTVWT